MWGQQGPTRQLILPHTLTPYIYEVVMVIIKWVWFTIKSIVYSFKLFTLQSLHTPETGRGARTYTYAPSDWAPSVRSETVFGANLDGGRALRDDSL
eukprot:scaffold9442_cov117-Isochrysis_galbana.AAC.10